MNTITTTTARALKATLKTVAPAVPRRCSIAALRCVRIGGGEIHSTDMTAYIIAPMPGADFAPVLADAKALRDALKALRAGDDVTLSTDGANLRIESRFGVSTLPGESVDDWPARPVRAESDVDEIAPDDPRAFTDALMAVATHASGDDSRLVLTATCVTIENGCARIMATDSYRLSQDFVPAAGELHARYLLPHAHGYLNHAGDVSQIARASWSAAPRMAVVTCERATVYLRTVEGTYPNFDQIIPTAWEHDILTPYALPDAVAHVIATAPDRGSETARFAFDGDVLTVSARDAAPGNGADLLLPTGSEVAEPFTIGLRASHVRDALRIMPRTARMSMISPLRPVLLTDPTGDSRRLVLIMHVRLPR